uniref:m7GpppN-mRNA hydrolase n=1 Tax=Ascaris suum TaxID=6253 RepID=F1KRL6_ASCSU
MCLADGMPSQPTQSKKSPRKKVVSEASVEERASGQASSSGAAPSRAPDEHKLRAQSSFTRKQHSQRGAASNRTQRHTIGSESKFIQSSNPRSSPDKTISSRQARSRNGEGGRTVGARMVKQMDAGHGLEEVFTAIGHCEPYDPKIRRPKPAVQVYQNRTFMNSSLSGGNNRSVAGSSGWNRSASSQYAGGFGPPIPEDVLNDICFRFLINIPEEEKSNVIRICFQIELAHWFYIDFYCKGDDATPKCAEIGLRDFIRQIFNHCDFLAEFSGQVDQVIEKWREYKSSVPTYGAILLDSSLNYVLLVQGYYARNSWGFPKGKVNESEEPTDCAAREVCEEVGFDISEKIRDNRLIQKFINETMTRLYIITDVPIDFPFAPKTRNEIGKIQWFSVWDLPTDRNNQKACERIGLMPNNFYTVMPFVNDLQAYIVRQQNKRNKSKPKMGTPLTIGARSASAFDPVLPHQKLEFMPSVFTSLFPGAVDSPLQKQTTGSVPSLVANRSSPTSAFFKPLSASSHPMSFTGASFLQLVTSGASASQSHGDFMRTNAVARPVPTVPKPNIPLLGQPVYEATRRHHNDRKSSSVETAKEEVNAVAQACSSNEMPSIGVWPGLRPKETSAQRRARRIRNRKSERETDSEENPLVADLRSLGTAYDIQKSPPRPEEPLVHLCEAWKNFKLDVSRFFVQVV